MKRRAFLTGLIATPAIIRAGVLMPVSPLPHQFVKGDLVNGDFIGVRVVDHIVDSMAYVWNSSYGRNHVAEPMMVSELTLFHGLPGNRVNNPSMRSKLVRTGNCGLRYINGDKVPA